MIYDCFIFFNELDLLEIRLNTLNEVVDKFVLVESDKTHTGETKELLFEKNKQRFEKFLDKIIHIKVQDCPDIQSVSADSYGNRWLLENFQRDSIMKGLVTAKNEDIIIISDLDEIPNPKIIKEYKDNSVQGIWVLHQKMMYYFLNNLCITNPVWDNGTRLGRYSDLLEPQQDFKTKGAHEFTKKGLPTYFRFCKGKIIKNGGWHFSYCGGVEAIIAKRKSISEQQYNTEKNMDPSFIKKMIKGGKDILGRRQFKYLPTKIDSNFPEYIVKNQDKYSHLVFQLSEEYLRYKKISLAFEIFFERLFSVFIEPSYVKFNILGLKLTFNKRSKK